MPVAAVGEGDHAVRIPQPTISLAATQCEPDARSGTVCFGKIKRPPRCSPMHPGHRWSINAQRLGWIFCGATRGILESPYAQLRIKALPALDHRLLAARRPGL